MERKQKTNNSRKQRGCLDVLLAFTGIVMASVAVTVTAGPKHMDWESDSARAATYPDTSKVDTTFVPEAKYIKAAKKK